MRFDPDNQPKSGNALRLWRWWERVNGRPPKYLDVCRPGRNQRAAGAAHYIIDGCYLIYSVPDALQQTMKDAQKDRATGDYHFD